MINYIVRISAWAGQWREWEGQRMSEVRNPNCIQGPIVSRVIASVASAARIFKVMSACRTCYTCSHPCLPPRWWLPVLVFHGPMVIFVRMYPRHSNPIIPIHDSLMKHLKNGGGPCVFVFVHFNPKKLLKDVVRVILHDVVRVVCEDHARGPIGSKLWNASWSTTWSYPLRSKEYDNQIQMSTRIQRRHEGRWCYMTEHESHKSHESSIVEHNIEESFEQCSRLEKACALNRVPDSELNMLAAALAGTGFEFASMCVFWTFLNNQRGIYNCSLKFPSHLARSGQIFEICQRRWQQWRESLCLLALSSQRWVLSTAASVMRQDVQQHGVTYADWATAYHPWSILCEARFIYIYRYRDLWNVWNVWNLQSRQVKTLYPSGPSRGSFMPPSPPPPAPRARSRPRHDVASAAASAVSSRSEPLPPLAQPKGSLLMPKHADTRWFRNVQEFPWWESWIWFQGVSRNGYLRADMSWMCSAQSAFEAYLDDLRCFMLRISE